MSENRKPITQQDLIAGLTKPVIPIAPTGAIYKESTSSLANKIVDMFVNNFGIIECDHVFMYPVQDKAGRIVDFNLTMYFDTTRGGANSTITRASGPKAASIGNGRADLRGLVGAKLSNGGFNITQTFKEKIGAVAELDNDNRIVIKADPDYNKIACVECNFFKIIGLCLGVSSDDNYDFSIIDCTPFRNSADNLDYNLVLTKEISAQDRRRGRNGINYEYADRRNMRAARR